MKNIFIRFNLMVLFTLLIIKFAVNPVIEKYGVKVIDKQLNQHYGELLKGPYFLIMHYYEGVSSENIPEKTRELQKEFGFPVNAVSLTSEELTGPEKKDLEQGKLLIRDEWKLYYQRVGHTKWAIKLGPFKDLDKGFGIWRFNTILWGVLICLVFLISLISAYPFWKNLKEVMHAAEHFGEGNFSARAEVSKRSPLKQVAETFNQMASRIGGLIQSQKLLINAVSHELRTPISRVRFGMEMLENTEDRTRIKKYASGIMDDLDDLESLVSELLAYAVFDRKKDFLNPERIDTVRWFNDVVAKLEPLAGEKKIELDLFRVPSHFRADAKFFSRALENLILNGIRYARSKVTINAEETGSQLRISVTDDGPGIPVDDMEIIFDPFVRLDESRNRESGGVGLGLAIVRQIVSGHRGRVWAEQPKGKGACVTILLPLDL